jgi:ABC-type transport system substrate-binding protein
MKGFRVLLLVLAALFVCSESGIASAENVVRWASPGGAATFDPHAYDKTPTYAQLVQVYEGLVGLDSKPGAGYSNPRVEGLIEQIGREIVTYGRDALIEEVWRTVLDDIVYIPLHYQIVVWAMRDHLDLPVNLRTSRSFARRG